jgi:hypothetical protein
LHDDPSQPVGIFHAVRYLRDDGALTAEQEEIADKVFDWLHDHLDAPGEDVLAANPEAVSWFRATAVSHIAQAERLVPILESHGYNVETARRLDPGNIVYADSAQVLALPLGSPEIMRVSSAINLGLLSVNGPAMLLLLGPLFVFSRLIDRGLIAREYNWVGLPVFLGGFVLGWLWWSLAVPRWRLWAYQRVDDITKLKEQAVKVGLTWPDDSVFTRTEIKSRDHARREKDFESHP